MKDLLNLIVWQKAHELVIEIYKITKDFPTDEKFGLINQMRKAAISVAANIAEGFKKRSKRDKINFYSISQGSLNELEYYLILTKDLDYCRDLHKSEKLIEEIGRMLNSLILSAESY